MISLRSLMNPMRYPERTVISVTRMLNISVTQSSIRKNLLEHPDYPSLLSISDVLRIYGINNLAIRMNRRDLANLPLPFIVHTTSLKSGEDLFSIVSGMDEESIALFDPEEYREKLLSNMDFDIIYRGTALALESTTHSGEVGFDKKVKNEKRKQRFYWLLFLCIPIIMILSVVLSFYTQYSTLAITASVFTFFTFLGSLLSILLLIYEVDQHSLTIMQICGSGRKVNCSAILNSRGAKIFGISWSVLGSVYFIGMFLSLLLGGLVNTKILFLLSWINLIALPYIIYSIYYQWIITKQWCVLCLAVQAMLILQFLVATAGNFRKIVLIGEISYQPYLFIITCFLLVFVSLLLGLPVFKEAKIGKQGVIELQRLKHNPLIFRSLLSKQRSITASVGELGITLGNPKAKNRLIKVCNPYCGPCARAHPIIEELLMNNDDLQLEIIFSIPGSEVDSRVSPVKHLMAIASQGDEERTRCALNDWYNAPVKDYNAFAAKYPLPESEIQNQSDKLPLISDWCREMHIEFTPTFFFNSYELPEIYSAVDLKFFLTT